MIWKYRKKPVVIEAVQFIGSSYQEVCDFIGKELSKHYNIGGVVSLIIPTLEGNLKADKYDYIIKGVNGEFYPCKPDIFEKTYEKVD